MQTKSILFSGLVALGLLAVSCQKQKVEPNNTFSNRSVAGIGEGAKFSGPVLGRIVVRSGNHGELPYVTWPNTHMHPTRVRAYRLQHPWLANKTVDIDFTPDVSPYDVTSGCWTCPVASASNDDGVLTFTNITFDATGKPTVGDLVVPANIDIDMTQFPVSNSWINIAVRVREHVPCDDDIRGGGNRNGGHHNPNPGCNGGGQWNPNPPAHCTRLLTEGNVQGAHMREYARGVVTTTSTGPAAPGLILKPSAHPGNQVDYSVSVIPSGPNAGKVKVYFTAPVDLIMNDLDNAYSYTPDYYVLPSMSSMWPVTNSTMTNRPLSAFDNAASTPISVDLDWIPGSTNINVGSYWHAQLPVSSGDNYTISVADFNMVP